MTSKSLRAGGFTLLETLFVVGIIGVLSAIAVPSIGNALGSFRLSGDARGVSNAIALSKLRAASHFSRVRLYVDVVGKSHHLEIFDNSSVVCCWTTEGGSTTLASSNAFGFGAISNAPPNTQGTIGAVEACKDNSGNNVANTACIIFNSRGIPIDSLGAATGNDALYITDGNQVYAVTVSATGMNRSWQASSQATATWMLQ